MALAFPTFQKFAPGRRLIEATITAALSVLVGTGPCSAAQAATQWMDGASQWSVGFVDDGAQSYCSLLWNSDTGKTVEFRQGLKSAAWHLSDADWNFPDNLSTKIVISGPRNILTIAAVADGKTGLNLTDRNGLVRTIIQNSIAGTIDLDLSIGDQGEEWEIPISRIYSMHSGVTKCLRRLYAHAATQPNNDPASGF